MQNKFWKEWLQDAGGDKEFYTYDYSLNWENFNDVFSFTYTLITV